VAFAGILLFMVVGPFYRQVLGERAPIFRAWTMFSKASLGLADVRFSQRRRDGTLTPIDHYELLGYLDWRQAPLELRRIRGLEGVHQVAKELCRILGGDADVRARVRIATRPGWRTRLMEADGNLCRQP